MDRTDVTHSSAWLNHRHPAGRHALALSPPALAGAGSADGCGLGFVGRFSPPQAIARIRARGCGGELAARTDRAIVRCRPPFTYVGAKGTCPCMARRLISQASGWLLPSGRRRPATTSSGSPRSPAGGICNQNAAAERFVMWALPIKGSDAVEDCFWAVVMGGD